MSSFAGPVAEVDVVMLLDRLRCGRGRVMLAAGDQAGAVHGKPADAPAPRLVAVVLTGGDVGGGEQATAEHQHPEDPGEEVIERATVDAGPVNPVHQPCFDPPRPLACCCRVPGPFAVSSGAGDSRALSVPNGASRVSTSASLTATGIALPCAHRPAPSSSGTSKSSPTGGHARPSYRPPDRCSIILIRNVVSLDAW